MLRELLREDHVLSEPKQKLWVAPAKSDLQGALKVFLQTFVAGSVLEYIAHQFLIWLLQCTS